MTLLYLKAEAKQITTDLNKNRGETFSFASRNKKCLLFIKINIDRQLSKLRRKNSLFKKCFSLE